MKIRSLVILFLLALLLAPLLAPMAGATFLEGGDIPDDYDPYLLAASSGLASSTTTDTGSTGALYGSDGLSSYPPVHNPSFVYSQGGTPMGPSQAPAISAQKAISTNMPSYVSSPPPVPAIRSFATATNTGAETVMPPDYNAPANSSKFNPPAEALEHANLAAMGYDVSKIGGIAMPSMPAGSPARVEIPTFRFPALFG